MKFSLVNVSQSKVYREMVSLDFSNAGYPAAPQLVDSRVKVTYWDVPGKEELLNLSCHLSSAVAAVVYVFDGSTFALLHHLHTH